MSGFFFAQQSSLRACTRLILSISLAIVCVSVTNRMQAQGTKSDYERMRQQSRLGRELVSGQMDQPHWTPNGNAVWYRVQVEPGKYQFFVVDLIKQEKQPVFDQQRVARELGRILKTEIDPLQLPFREVTFGDDLKHVYFRVQGKSFRVDRTSKEIKSVQADEVPDQDETGPKLKPSSDSEEVISIQFTNRRSGTVVLFRVNENGRPERKMEIKSGESKKLETFKNNVWQVKSRSGRELTVFEATRDGQTFSVSNRTGSRRNQNRVGTLPQPSNSFASSRSTAPNGKYRVQVKDHNLVLFDMEKNEETQLTKNGSADQYFRGTYWSPDSRYLVSFEETPGQNRQINMIESSPRRGDKQPRLHSMRYVKPGDRIRISKPKLFDVVNRKPIEFSDEQFKNPWRIDQLRWKKDSSEFTFRFNQRGHQVMSIIGVKTADGHVRTIVDEVSKTFIDYTNKAFVNYLDESNEIVWQSERDGWSHLYLYDAKTGNVKHPVTKGEWVVRRVHSVDHENRQVWFEASGIFPEQDPYYLHHCRIDLDGNNLVVMTEGDGTHRVEYSPDRKWLIDRYSRVDMPTKVELRATASGKRVCELAAEDHSKLLKTGWKEPKRFVTKARDGKTDIHGVIYLPSRFDPSKKYPVVEYIYAGPHGSFVPKSFSMSRREKSLAELGFIVVQVDGMGTSNRSKAFHDVCWKNLGDSGFPDRRIWIEAAAKEVPQMDLTRVGIFGGSAGGQSALRALLAHGDFYHVAVSDCGCHDNRMDKIWWNEQWMGWPIGPHYAEQSNVTNAHRLKGKLFLIVGELDRNVDPASTMQVVNALVKADKDFDLLVVPGGGHGAGFQPYGWRRTCDFLVRHLIGVEPRSN